MWSSKSNQYIKLYKNYTKEKLTKVMLINTCDCYTKHYYAKNYVNIVVLKHI